jgi:hypothetical protein
VRNAPSGTITRQPRTRDDADISRAC